MSASIETPPSVRSAFLALIDYAGLFPPAKLEMGPAVAEYLAARAGADSWMLGRFIVPASRIGELAAFVRDGVEPIALSVIVDASVEPRTWLASVQVVLAEIARVRERESKVRVEALEVPLPRLLSQRETYDAQIGQFSALAHNARLRDLPMYLEIPRDARWLDAQSNVAAALSRAKLGGKIRCGGVTDDAFPSPAEVVAFVRAHVAESVPFKATAGLHHPVRGLNAESAFVMHGFLNLLAAAAFAGRMDEQALTEIVSDENPRSFGFEHDTFYWRGERVSEGDVAVTRAQRLVGYGSCSFSEPVDDLSTLGILSRAG